MRKLTKKEAFLVGYRSPTSEILINNLIYDAMITNKHEEWFKSLHALPVEASQVDIRAHIHRLECQRDSLIRKGVSDLREINEHIENSEKFYRDNTEVWWDEK